MSTHVELSSAVSESDRFVRQRSLQINRAFYQWQHLAGLPAFCDGLPAPEIVRGFSAERFDTDIAVGLASAAVSAISWYRDRRQSDRVSSYDHLYPFRREPAVAKRWRSDEEFARQRLNGVNPLQIRSCERIPDHFAVDDDRVRPVLGAHTLASLAGSGRLYLCDWAPLDGVPTNLGRFLTAPMVLFWVDERGVLMPLAIQLGQSVEQAPVVFTPRDDYWLWMAARTHVQTADAAYHELVVHLFRTHLLMETMWVALNRAVPPQHPVYELLAPHFAGTIDINEKARTELLVPGGPIDVAISVGTDGSYWLINQALRSFTFDDLDPRRDIDGRGVADAAALPGYYYRDDALRLWDVIGAFVEDVLRLYYPDDATVAADDELAAWAVELTGDGAGGLAGLPVTSGRFARFDDLHQVVRQIVYTASVEHSAVNNGQWDIFGYIPNAPGSVYLPAPTTLAPWDEGEFTYCLPPMKDVDDQLALVHLLSRPPLSRLGYYPTDFFLHEHRVHAALDRFRNGLDRIAIEIEERNRFVPVPYTYLDPVQIAISVNV